MDKPMSMSVKDYLIRILAVKMMVDEKTVEAVVNHQFTSCLEAMKTNDSVELSGFGKMYFNRNKANKKYEKGLSKKAFFQKQVDDESLSPAKRLSALNKLNNTILGLENLKPKVDEFVANLSGMEEQAVPFSRNEGAN